MDKGDLIAGDQNARAVGDGGDGGKLAAGGIIERNPDRSGVEDEAVRGGDGNGPDLIEVGGDARFVLDLVGDKPVAGVNKGGVARQPALGIGVEVIHAGRHFLHTPRGCR